jgi:hypothetical protein
MQRRRPALSIGARQHLGLKYSRTPVLTRTLYRQQARPGMRQYAAHAYGPMYSTVRA